MAKIVKKDPRAAPVSFEMDELERFIVAKMIPTSLEPARWAAMNAVRHMSRGWRLREIDPEMAAFRAITGEEEAATALFKALRRLRYRGARQLKLTKHLYKNAVTPFLAGVWKLLNTTRTIEQLAPEGYILEPFEGSPKPRLLLKKFKTINGVLHAGEVQPPLGMRVTWGPLLRDGTIDPATEEPYDFRAVVAEIEDQLEGRAKLRNDILYATDEGYPGVVTPIEPFLLTARRNTFLILTVYLLVDGYRGRQRFAQQCLLSFLKMLVDEEIEVTFD